MSVKSLEHGLSLNQVEDRKGHSKRSRADGRGKGLEVCENTAGPRASSGLLWLRWGWQMETELEGEGVTSQILDPPGPQPEWTAPSPDLLPTGWACAQNSKNSLSVVLCFCSRHRAQVSSPHKVLITITSFYR